jgi:glycosyltransferase involved in cell wall biosynthesis
MRILILPDTPHWVVNRCADALIGNLPHVEFVKRYYACSETTELVELAKTCDAIYFMNWDCERHWPAINETGTPVLLGIRSHRYPPYVKRVAKEVAAVHVLNAGLEAEFPGSHRIPDGVDDRFFRRPVVGFAGKPDAYKGYPLVVEACKRLGLELRTATGNVAPEDMPSWYRSIDVLVCASEAEGTGLPVLEALAMGVPVISSRVGEAWLSNVNGPHWYFRNSANEIVEAIVAVLGKRADTMGQLERYCWPNLAPEYEGLFVKVAAMKAVTV